MTLQDALSSSIADQTAKVSPEEASYTDGTYPWVCGTCAMFHFTQGSQGTCDLVDGPYDGEVDLEDTCRLYEPEPTSFEGGASSEQQPQ